MMAEQTGDERAVNAPEGNPGRPATEHTHGRGASRRAPAVRICRCFRDSEPVYEAFVRERQRSMRGIIAIRISASLLAIRCA